jgi:hypothetical protein
MATAARVETRAVLPAVLPAALPAVARFVVSRVVFARFVFRACRVLVSHAVA